MLPTWSELRIALRTLRRSRVFATFSVVALALAIAANTTMSAMWQAQLDGDVYVARMDGTEPRVPIQYSVSTYFVDPQFLKTLGATLVEGSDFQVGEGGPIASVILDQTAARWLWPHSSAVGHLIHFGPTERGSCSASTSRSRTSWRHRWCSSSPPPCWPGSPRRCARRAPTRWTRYGRNERWLAAAREQSASDVVLRQNQVGSDSVRRHAGGTDIPRCAVPARS
jgi:hypothetical protein